MNYETLEKATSLKFEIEKLKTAIANYKKGYVLEVYGIGMLSNFLSETDYKEIKNSILLKMENNLEKLEKEFETL